MTLTHERIALRFADVGDAFALAGLRTAGLIELGLLDPGDAAAFRRRAYDEMRMALHDERLVAWVVVADGRVAGCACLVLWDRLPYAPTSRHAELAGVYVEPALRRRGYARELVTEALASASAYDVRRTFIAPTRPMEGFYRSCGFADAGWLKS